MTSFDVSPFSSVSRLPSVHRLPSAATFLPVPWPTAPFLLQVVAAKWIARDGHPGVSPSRARAQTGSSTVVRCVCVFLQQVVDMDCSSLASLCSLHHGKNELLQQNVDPRSPEQAWQRGQKKCRSLPPSFRSITDVPIFCVHVFLRSLARLCLCLPEPVRQSSFSTDARGLATGRLVRNPVFRQPAAFLLPVRG
jgi:hypothetical protein